MCWCKRLETVRRPTTHVDRLDPAPRRRDRDMSTAAHSRAVNEALAEPPRRVVLDSASITLPTHGAEHADRAEPGGRGGRQLPRARRRGRLPAAPAGDHRPAATFAIEGRRVHLGTTLSNQDNRTTGMAPEKPNRPCDGVPPAGPRSPIGFLASPGREAIHLDGGHPRLFRRLRQQPGHVHLRDAQFGGDLRLGHVAEEAHGQDLALPLGQRGQQRLDRLAVVDRLHARVEVADGSATPRSVSGPAGADSDTGLYSRATSIASATSSSVNARGAGRCRPGRRGADMVWLSSTRARLTCSRSSCSRRGTLMRQPLSRKYRRISPTMVGVA